MTHSFHRIALILINPSIYFFHIESIIHDASYIFLKQTREFPGSPVVKDLCFVGDTGSIPGESKIPHAACVAKEN